MNRLTARSGKAPRGCYLGDKIKRTIVQPGCHSSPGLLVSEG